MKSLKYFFILDFNKFTFYLLKTNGLSAEPSPSNIFTLYFKYVTGDVLLAVLALLLSMYPELLKVKTVPALPVYENGVKNHCV